MKPDRGTWCPKKMEGRTLRTFVVLMILSLCRPAAADSCPPLSVASETHQAVFRATVTAVTSSVVDDGLVLFEPIPQVELEILEIYKGAAPRRLTADLKSHESKQQFLLPDFLRNFLGKQLIVVASFKQDSNEHHQLQWCNFYLASEDDGGQNLRVLSSLSGGTILEETRPSSIGPERKQNDVFDVDRVPQATTMIFVLIGILLSVTAWRIARKPE